MVDCDPHISINIYMLLIRLKKLVWLVFVSNIFYRWLWYFESNKTAQMGCFRAPDASSKYMYFSTKIKIFKIHYGIQELILRFIMCFARSGDLFSLILMFSRNIFMCTAARQHYTLNGHIFENNCIQRVFYFCEVFGYGSGLHKFQNLI